jgi:hypothetical protein
VITLVVEELNHLVEGEGLEFLVAVQELLDLNLLVEMQELTVVAAVLDIMVEVVDLVMVEQQLVDLVDLVLVI